CAAELTLGNKNDYRDWLYLFIGFFIGGGVALSGSLFPGRTGYAGAMGPMPFDKDPDSNSWKPLMLGASLCTLETRLTESGLDPSILSDEPADWRHLGAPLDLWIEEAATNLAFAIVTATAVIDFEAIVVDGGLPPDVRSRIVERIRNGVTGFDRRGLPPIEIVEGSIGSAAREIGGACLPLLANYSRDREVLFKETI
ncbi:MAG: ROK family protein, partial [Hyphomicrobiales bacterium]|nr:ROK family protein [Hyphomicrobiales bacterium]